jgi:hypothetical protein
MVYKLLSRVFRHLSLMLGSYIGVGLILELLLASPLIAVLLCLDCMLRRSVLGLLNGVRRETTLDEVFKIIYSLLNTVLFASSIHFLNKVEQLLIL